MDKYEYRLKAEQIEKLANKKDFESAAKIADTIDWRRVKNLNMLYIVSDVYEAMECYEDCMEILNIAYDKASVGRMLLYKMTEIATKMHQFEEAISLYREFVKVAPHDQSRYILKYQIYRERGSALEDQIRILKDYKAHEYQEKWAYELASLYAQAGMTDECVRECDELILWFSEGEYVRKAMELKMQYAPLTAAQQEKYEHSDKPMVSEDDFEGTEVDFNADKFSTMNLQAELAANLDEILQPGEEIEIPDLDASTEEAKEEKSEEPELEELDLSVEPELEELDPDTEPEKTIEETDVEEVDFPELDTLDMDLETEEPELEDDLPELEPLEDAAVEEEAAEEPLELESLDLESLETEEEPELEDDLPELEPLEEIPEEEEEPADELLTIPDVLAEWEQKKAETEARLEATAKQEEERKAQVMQKTAELMKLISGESEEIPQDVRDLLNEIEQEKQEKAAAIETEDDLPSEIENLEVPEEEGEALEDLTEQIKVSPEPKAEPEPEKVSSETASLNMIQDLQNTMSLKVAELAVRAGHLSREQARVFSYFATVKGMGKQLSGLLKGEAPSARSNSSKGNVVITGSKGNGKTTLAIDIVKAFQKEKRLDGHKLAKISGSKLNSKDIQEVLSKLKGGALIIENAGGLESSTLMALSLAMEGDTGGLLIILEGTEEDIQKIFLKNKNFASKFDYRVEVPVFSNEELVNFAKSYALENGYSLDEFAVLALYDKIGSRQTLENNVTVTEVKEILDEAMDRSEKGGVKRFFAKMTKKNIDEDGNTILREEDFEEV